MMECILNEVGYTDDETAICNIINKLLDKDFYDQSGLIYGFGHAVYTISDPRAELLKNFCRDVAEKKGRLRKYGLNALLTMLEAEKTNRTVYYETLEPDPVPESVYTRLNYPDMLGSGREVIWL